jgi:S-(hydroxymethyl)glutathione dehydrogenase/alcohol dehydrogenase
MKAAVFRKPHEPLTIEEVEIDKPRGREVLVRTVAAGVCHSDLHIVEGLSFRPLGDQGWVLGHESAGVVEAVGPDVSTIRVGDHVVGCLSGFCGACEQCLSGHPNICSAPIVARPAGEPARLSQDGKALGQFLNISGYAETMLLHENSVVKVDDDLPFDKVAIVGCGVLTGAGAAMRTAGIEPGQTVAVFGCGGVGLSIIQGARITGARQIIAVDQYDSKLEMAKSVGATHAVNSSSEDAVEGVKRHTNGKGVDHAFEAVGLSVLVRQAIESLGIRGTATIVGVLPGNSMIEFPWLAIRPECTIKTSRMGSNRFKQDIPMLLEFYRQGRLDLDTMVSAHRRLEDINDCFRAMRAGEVARSVLMLE